MKKNKKAEADGFGQENKSNGRLNRAFSALEYNTDRTQAHSVQTRLEIGQLMDRAAILLLRGELRRLRSKLAEIGLIVNGGQKR